MASASSVALHPGYSALALSLHSQFGWPRRPGSETRPPTRDKLQRGSPGRPSFLRAKSRRPDFHKSRLRVRKRTHAAWFWSVPVLRLGFGFPRRDFQGLLSSFRRSSAQPRSRRPNELPHRTLRRRRETMVQAGPTKFVRRPWRALSTDARVRRLRARVRSGTNLSAPSRSDLRHRLLRFFASFTSLSSFPCSGLPRRGAGVLNVGLRL